MTTARSAPEAEPARRPRRDLARIYRLEIRNELLKTLRLPVFSVFTVVFPVLFYLVFGLTFGGESAGAVDSGTYMLATYGAFGIIGSALFGFGTGVASERGQGWMILKRASPMPPLAYFVAKLAMAVTFGAVTVLALFVVASLVIGVDLPLSAWARLLGVLLLGSLPFCAIGMALGYATGPNSAPVVVNLLYLPMSFLSGLWMPLEILPAAIRALAPALPAYHLGRLALGAVGAGTEGGAATHVAVLVVFTLAFLALGLVLYRRDEGRTFG